MSGHQPVLHIVGGGLAGSEAAWQGLKAGFRVILHEMRPQRMTAAHQTGNLAELVCSNSLKSLQEDSAPGLLKREMAAFDSLIIRAATAARVPAGNALAVDRVVFSNYIADALGSSPLFERRNDEITAIPRLDTKLDGQREAWIIASGPLTSDALAAEIQKLAGTGYERLYFYDAIAPVIDADSIDMTIAFRAGRYEDGEGDYLNLPMNEAEYSAFIQAVAEAEKTPLHEFEKVKYFEACLPIEVMVERGPETLRFGPMKPVGLTDPRTGKWPFACVQLRQENTSATMFSMVGFQTKMKWPEQARVFRMIPGLAGAEFLRFGSVHRNTYVESPKVLGENLAFKNNPDVFLAGQITGVEGYTESAAIGLMAARAAGAWLTDSQFSFPPPSTMLGALVHYVTKGCLGPFQPMNCNMGLLPKFEAPRQGRKKMAKSDRKALQCDATRKAFDQYFFGKLEADGENDGLPEGGEKELVTETLKGNFLKAKALSNPTSVAESHNS